MIHDEGISVSEAQGLLFVSSKIESHVSRHLTLTCRNWKMQVCFGGGIPKVFRHKH